MKIKYTYIIIALVVGLNFSSLLGQTSSHTFQHNGLTREYDLYVPSIYYGNEPVPIVFNLHGYTSNKEEQTVYGDFRSIADTANFIIVHPNGTFDLSNERWWNAFGVLGGPDDVDFIISLLNELNQNYNIDLNRVYSTGMSNGGFMSFELACEASTVFTAVASVTGSMPINKPNNCGASQPIPAMQIHGTADLVVPYNGNAQFASVEDVVDFWVNQVQANTTPIQTNLPDIDPNDGSTVEHYVYQGGDFGSTVEHYKVIDGGHTWPGSVINLPSSGSTNQDFNASVEIWRFFSQFSKENTSNTDSFESLKFSVFPNPSSGEFSLELPPGEKKILINDLTGRKVLEMITSDDFKTFELARGTYVVHVLRNGAKANKKLVVQ
jgi:polyhydroxybutyrate depolymerase